MNVDLHPDFPVDDESCRAATGKTLDEWSELLSAKPELAGKRRESISWLWDQTDRSSTAMWWGTTIYVEHERRLGKVQKDGRPEGYNICVTKSVAAPIERVLGALVNSIPSERVTRVRDGKDVRATWHTPGTEAPTELEAMVKEATGKVGITLYHKRIETRAEADGLRRAWQGRLDEIKRELES